MTWDPDCMPDVLGLHARRPEAPLIKVMLGCDSGCVCVQIPDADVGHRGFHDVVLVDRMRHMWRSGVGLSDRMRHMWRSGVGLSGGLCLFAPLLVALYC